MKRRTVLTASLVGVVGCLEDDSDTGDHTNRTSVVNSGTRTKENSSESDNPVEFDGSSSSEEPFDDFSDLSLWTVEHGSLEAGHRGESPESQTAILKAKSGDDRVTISRTESDPIDCTTVAPGLTITVPSSVLPTIQLYDQDGNRADFRRYIIGDRRWMRYNFGLTAVDGNPDLSAITEIRIVLWAGDRSRKLRIDDLFFVDRPSSGAVMLQFDDGFETDYTEGYRILDRYDYPAVTFVNPGSIGNSGRLSLEQCSQLKDAGWVVANHTYSHANLSDLEPANQTVEILDARNWLLDHGFEQGAQYFAYPFGEWDTHTLDIVDRHHDLAFGGGRGVHGYPANPSLCTRVGEPSAETAINLLSRAARWGGYVGLFYHELSGQQLDNFERTIEHLHALESAGRIEVVMPSDIKRNAV